MEVKFCLQDRIKHLYNIKMSMYNNLFCRPSGRFKKISSFTVKVLSLKRASIRRSANVQLVYYNKISDIKYHNRNNIKTHSHDSSISFSRKAYEPPVYMMEDEEEWDDD